LGHLRDGGVGSFTPPKTFELRRVNRVHSSHYTQSNTIPTHSPSLSSRPPAVMAEKQHNLTVLISGNGSNLQALIDACASGALPNTRVTHVISKCAFPCPIPSLLLLPAPDLDLTLQIHPYLHLLIVVSKPSASNAHAPPHPQYQQHTTTWSPTKRNNLTTPTPHDKPTTPTSHPSSSPPPHFPTSSSAQAGCTS